MQKISNPLSWQYFLLGVFLWTLIDFGTAGGFRWSYFQTYGFTLLLFYIVFPLIFTILIFKFHWGGTALFLATLVTIFLVEVIFTGNPLLTTFPALLAGIPLAIVVYVPLTYFPLWIVRGEMGRHKLVAGACTFVIVVIVLLTTLGSG